MLPGAGSMELQMEAPGYKASDLLGGMCFDIMFVPAGKSSIRSAMVRRALQEPKALGSFCSCFRFGKKLLGSKPVFFLYCILSPPPFYSINKKCCVWIFSYFSYEGDKKLMWSNQQAKNMLASHMKYKSCNCFQYIYIMVQVRAEVGWKMEITLISVVRTNRNRAKTHSTV